MEGIITLAVIWLLVGPLAALIVALVAGSRAAETSRRLKALEAQLAALAARPPERAPARSVVPAVPGQAAAAAAGAALAEEAEPAEPPAPAGPWVEATPTAAPAPQPAPVGASTAAPGPLETLEGKIGGRWSVLVGGLALALGAIFLVRFSIEQGLIGPRLRIGLGLLLAAVLLAAGEWLRRRDRAVGAPVFARADVPAVLTGAGALAGFATVYAAHALYGFIGPAAGFLLLTIVGLATLALSAIHGPALAALGVLGSYAAPLLVSSAEPKPFPLVFHTLAVTAAVLALARIRGWRWLAVAGVAASLGWGILTGLIVDVNAAAAELVLGAGLALTYLGTLVAEPPGYRDRPPNWLALAALSGLAALSVYFALVNPAYPPLVAGILLAGGLGAAASRWPSIAAAALIAGAVAVATVMLIRVPGAAAFDQMQVWILQWRVLGDEGIAAFALKALVVAMVVGIGGVLSAERTAGTAPGSAGFFAAAGVAAPLLILVVVYARHVPFETRPAIGIAALALAGLFAAAAERLIGARPGDPDAPAPALYAAGAVLSLAFAMAVGLEKTFIPLALSLGAAGVVWVSLQRAVRILPWLAVFCAGLACLALLTHPGLDPAEIGTRPLLNGLALRFGLPAGAVLLAGEMLRRRRDGIPAAILQAIGLALLGLFVALQIRHLANAGALDARPPGLGEQGALTLAALAFALGLQRIGRRTASPVYRSASLVAGLIGAAMIALAHFVTANPLFTAESVGAGAFVNLLLPGYLLPALAAAGIAHAARGVRPRWFVLVFAALGLALGFLYLTLMVRHAFHGEFLAGGRLVDAENWAYSAVWLLYGIALLAAGILLRSAILRAASAAVVAAVVCKVFLFDMAALTGALRAASFLGLGAVLLVIGRIYQRLLARGRSGTAAAQA